jgi:flagellar protein FliS
VNPLQTYQQNSVTTASAKSIIVRLHEKAILDIDQAYKAWKEARLSDMRPHITMVQDIISYLHGSLDPEIELTQTMTGLYRYQLIQLANLFINPTEQLFDEVKQFLTEWRDAWRQAE